MFKILFITIPSLFLFIASNIFANDGLSTLEARQRLFEELRKSIQKSGLDTTKPSYVQSAIPVPEDWGDKTTQEQVQKKDGEKSEMT